MVCDGGRRSPSSRRPGLIAVRLPDDDRAKVDAALREGERISDFVRLAIERELSRRANSDQPPEPGG